ncbi:hypothetical protein [Streptomyces sp. NPDC091268]|uniref:hypothetical protein n=1 Tax=Streptomyces sp. NPDC091268 TaxID=3365979 RepID=UPI0037F259DC
MIAASADVRGPDDEPAFVTATAQPDEEPPAMTTVVMTGGRLDRDAGTPARGAAAGPTGDPVVTLVRSRADRTTFVRLPYTLYEGSRAWVAPLESELRRLLSPRRHPFLRRTTSALFLVRRSGAVLGRVAAIVNPDRARPGQFDGFFGFFECAHDPRSAQALMESAYAWLRAQGCMTVTGPMSPNLHHECGLLVDGFDDPPLLGMPYNLPYYPHLLSEAGGLQPVMDLLSWRADPRGKRAELVQRLGEWSAGHLGVTMRGVDWRRFDDEVTVVRSLYSRCWDRNWGFAPMTRSEAVHMARQLRSVAPEGIRIAEQEGVAVGFTIVMPDLNQAIAAARGRLARWGVPVGAWRLLRARQHLSRGRLMATGTLPDSAPGLGVVLFAEALREANRQGWKEVDISWMLEDNAAANAPLAAGGAELYKRHRLYARCLAHGHGCPCLAPPRESRTGPEHGTV